MWDIGTFDKEEDTIVHVLIKWSRGAVLIIDIWYVFKYMVQLKKISLLYRINKFFSLYHISIKCNN